MGSAKASGSPTGARRRTEDLGRRRRRAGVVSGPNRPGLPARGRRSRPPPRRPRQGPNRAGPCQGGERGEQRAPPPAPGWDRLVVDRRHDARREVRRWLPCRVGGVLLEALAQGGPLPGRLVRARPSRMDVASSVTPPPPSISGRNPLEPAAEMRLHGVRWDARSLRRPRPGTARRRSEARPPRGTAREVRRRRLGARYALPTRRPDAPAGGLEKADGEGEIEGDDADAVIGSVAAGRQGDSGQDQEAAHGEDEASDGRAWPASTPCDFPIGSVSAAANAAFIRTEPRRTQKVSERAAPDAIRARPRGPRRRTSRRCRPGPLRSGSHPWWPVPPRRRRLRRFRHHAEHVELRARHRPAIPDLVEGHAGRDVEVVRWRAGPAERPGERHREARGMCRGEQLLRRRLALRPLGAGGPRHGQIGEQLARAGGDGPGAGRRGRRSR